MSDPRPPAEPDLRAVAKTMRADHGPEHERHTMWDAMAMLLDAHAHLRSSGSLFDAATERCADLVAETYMDARPPAAESGTPAPEETLRTPIETFLVAHVLCRRYPTGQATESAWCLGKGCTWRHRDEQGSLIHKSWAEDHATQLAALLSASPVAETPRMCDTCQGTGTIPWLPGQHRNSEDDEQPCPDCDGRGSWTPASPASETGADRG